MTERPDAALNHLLAKTHYDDKHKAWAVDVKQYIEHLEEQLANQPFEITGDKLTDEMEVWLFSLLSPGAWCKVGAGHQQSTRTFIARRKPEDPLRTELAVLISLGGSAEDLADVILKRFNLTEKP